LERLKAKGLMFDQDGASWIKVSEYGAPKDEVLVKSDGLPAYFAADIAYHMDKFDRGYRSLLDIWGPDHHGHILRMTAALKAAGYPADRFTVLIGQQVSLLSGGEKVKMSKREGKFVTLEELLGEVGVDAARFFFIMRTASSHLDFDLEVAKKQSDENPVFYVQYAHARICSLLTKCSELGLEPAAAADKMGSLTEKESIVLLKEILSFPEMVAEAGMSYEPHRLVSYLMNLSAAFHGFYTQHRIKEAPKEVAEARLALVLGVRIVLKNALDLMGVTAPEAM
jgi:arginyl-tRNA synthetase